MKQHLGRVATAAAMLSSAFVVAASQPQPAPAAVGIWRGTSLCLVRPSACKDENVVYRITRIGAGDSLSIDAGKIVNGVEEQMGVLRCLFARATHDVTCRMPNGTWRFTVRGDSLVGELRVPDGTKFRDVRTARDKTAPPRDRSFGN